MRRLLLLVPVLAVLLATGAGAAWWFLIREDAKLATSAPDIPAGLVDATPTDAPGDGATQGTLTFRINPELSEAAYFVDEELASVGIPSTAKGSTKQIEGEFVLSADGTSLAPDATSSFTVDLRNLASDKPMRDRRVQEALETSRYPAGTFTVTGVTGYNPAIPEGQEQSLQMAGVLNLHGVERNVTWDVKAKREANVISALATLTVSFVDFKITPPTFAGLVSIDDKATLQVQLIAQTV